jgi:hypothetical protein
VKGAPPSKWRGANDSPSRDAYWRSKRLQARKVRNLVRHCGMSEAQALAYWLRVRTKRMRTSMGSSSANAA